MIVDCEDNNRAILLNFELIEQIQCSKVGTFSQFIENKKTFFEHANTQYTMINHLVEKLINTNMDRFYPHG